MTNDLKPVNYGCGGEAEVKSNNTQYFKRYWVDCTVCKIGTEWCGTESEAIRVWNRAMGAKDINVPNKFTTDTNVGDKTSKFKQDGEFLRCGKCNHIVDSGYKYCPECGCRLEW